MQLIFAGKAHPADDLGKEMIRQMVQFARGPAVRHRIAFIEDYDIAVARTLLQGCDVWLNNPRRPMEASGTSGQKAALNGALNLSVLDGWWDEMFDGKNGWQIASAEAYVDLQRRDEVEANSLFEILERQVVPLYYDRGRRPLPSPMGGPHQGLPQLARAPGPGVADGAGLHQADVRAHGQEGRRPQRQWLRPGQGSGGLEGAACSRPGKWWPCCPSTSTPTALVTDLGATRQATAEVSLGDLEPSEVAVELLHGPVRAADEIEDWQTVPMELEGPGSRAGDDPLAG